MPLAVERLARLKPIQGLSPARLKELAQLCSPQAYVLGSDPWRGMQGVAQFVYLLAGELKIVLPDGSMRLLVGNCDDALWPLGYRNALPVSSKAVTDVLMLSFDFDLLDIMMTWDGLSAVAGETSAAGGAAWCSMTGGLSAQALTEGALSKLPPAHIHTLLQRFERMPARHGQTIIREGDEGDYFYLIESGRAVVTRERGGVVMSVADLKAGDAFGEEALVSDSRRNATVSMRTDGVLLRLAKPDFIALLQAPLLHGVGPAEAQQRIDAGAVWLDVRFPAEFAENGLPGAMNLPLNEVRSALELLDPAREYIVYCQSGRRSSAAAFLLAQHGFQAAWLKGGLDRMEKP